MKQLITPVVKHRFVLDVCSEEGKPLHEVPLERPDFDRAIEAVFFEALREGKFSDYAPPLDRARIEPLFSGDGPRTRGFEVVLPTALGEFRRKFDLDYFRTQVRRTGAQLAVDGKVSGDATVAFHLTAFADEPTPKRRGGLVIDLESETPAIPVCGGSRKALGVTAAWDNPAPEDLPVLFPRHVIEESVAEARKHPDREVGGVLLGHLRRDDDNGDLFLEVTCLVPGEQTEATKVSVTFTHDTWARVREVADWRDEGELIVGWMHSHPFRLCAECPNSPPPECQGKVLFYSADDEFLMELSFPRPFMVGLLAAVEPKLESALGHPPVKLFGWKGAVIVPRGFEVIEE